MELKEAFQCCLNWSKSTKNNTNIMSTKNIFAEGKAVRPVDFSDIERETSSPSNIPVQGSEKEEDKPFTMDQFHRIKTRVDVK